MSAEIIDGKAFAAKIRAEVAQECAAFRAQTGVQPGLAVVLVGNDAASEVYVRNKGIQAKEAGFNSLEYRLPAETTQSELLAQVAALNADPQVHGILVQLPLPAHLDADAVLNAIAPDKDVDGFHPVNVGRLWTGNPVSIPCTPLGCALILKDRLGDLSGKRAIVIGRSNIVGKPMGMLLLERHATVTLCHSRTENLAEIAREADILVAAVGQPHFVTADMVKPGATVIDVGINRIAPKKLVGDVDFEAVEKVAGAITPVPGGVGLLTVAMLMQNVVYAARMQKK